jgi:hypothetical protein
VNQNTRAGFGIFDGLRRRIAILWFVANSMGVPFSIAVQQSEYYRNVARGDYWPPRAGHVPFIFVWVTFVIVLGGWQVLACSWLMSLVKLRIKAVQVTLGVICGILTGLAVILAGILLTGYVFDFSGYFGEFNYHAEALLGFWTFLLSGIVFGGLTGYSQLRLIFQHKSNVVREG